MFSKPIKLPNTLSFRLPLWYATTFVGFLGVGFISLYISVHTILDNKMDEDMLEDIEEFALLNEQEGLEKVKQEMIRETLPENSDDVFLRLINSQGEVIFSTNLEAWDGLGISNDLLHKVINGGQAELENLKLDSREFPSKIVYGSIGKNLYLQVGESLEDQQEIMNVMSLVFFVMFLLVAPLASFFGWIVANRAVLGIKEVSQAAIDIQHGKFNRKVTTKNQRDEVQTLMQSFNSMAQRIQKLISEMREMTDNIAHDLRSPLARIRVISENALADDTSLQTYKSAAKDTLRECDRLLQLINTTLDVAEAEAGIGQSRQERINLSELAADACELFQPVAEEKQIELLCKVKSQSYIIGNKSGLQRMLANVIDNAIKYTLQKGTVEVSLTQDNQLITLTVSDTGIGIPESDQTRVFERFFRCDQSRSNKGCGLGLSYSRAVARAHGGEILLLSEPEKSSIFTIQLPLNNSIHATRV